MYLPSSLLLQQVRWLICAMVDLEDVNLGCQEERSRVECKQKANYLPLVPELVPEPTIVAHWPLKSTDRTQRPLTISTTHSSPFSHLHATREGSSNIHMLLPLVVDSYAGLQC